MPILIGISLLFILFASTKPIFFYSASFATFTLELVANLWYNIPMQKKQKGTINMAFTRTIENKKVGLQFNNTPVLNNDYVYVQTFLANNGNGIILAKQTKNSPVIAYSYPELKVLANNTNLQLAKTTKPLNMTKCKNEQEMKKNEQIFAFSITHKNKTCFCDFKKVYTTGKKYNSIFMLLNKDANKYYTIATPTKHGAPVMLAHNYQTKYLSLNQVSQLAPNPIKYAFMRYDSKDDYSSPNAISSLILAESKAYAANTNATQEQTNYILKYISNNLTARAHARQTYNCRYDSLLNATKTSISELKKDLIDAATPKELGIKNESLSKLTKQEQQYSHEIQNQNNFVTLSYNLKEKIKHTNAEPELFKQK